MATIPVHVLDVPAAITRMREVKASLETTLRTVAEPVTADDVYDMLDRATQSLDDAHGGVKAIGGKIVDSGRHSREVPAGAVPELDALAGTMQRAFDNIQQAGNKLVPAWEQYHERQGFVLATQLGKTLGDTTAPEVRPLPRPVPEWVTQYVNSASRNMHNAILDIEQAIAELRSFKQR
jgi:hypothetical protein